MESSDVFHQASLPSLFNSVGSPIFAFFSVFSCNLVFPHVLFSGFYLDVRLCVVAFLYLCLDNLSPLMCLHPVGLMLCLTLKSPPPVTTVFSFLFFQFNVSVVSLRPCCHIYSFVCAHWKSDLKRRGLCAWFVTSQRVRKPNLVKLACTNVMWEPEASVHRHW